MVGVLGRMHKLHGRLAIVRSGFGAAVFPAGVQRLVLTYAAQIDDGHMGPRKFWRLHLPRLKYHNPSVQMDVVQRKEIGGPATLVVEFKDGRKEAIDCQHKHENDITKALLLLTEAKAVPIDERDAILANEYQREALEREQTKHAKLAKRASKRDEARLEAGVTA